MNELITLTGSNQTLEFTAPCRVVWVEPISGTGTVTVSYATLRARGQTSYKWNVGPTIDLTSGVAERVLPDFFPCAAVQLNGTASSEVKVMAGEPIDMSPRAPLGVV